MVRRSAAITRATFRHFPVTPRFPHAPLIEAEMKATTGILSSMLAVDFSIIMPIRRA